MDTWQFWIYLISLAIVNTLQVIFLQKGFKRSLFYSNRVALRTYSALFIIPIYQVSLNIAGVVVGGIFFKEFNQFSYLPAYYPVLFVVGILTSIFGVFILAQRQGKLTLFI